MDKRRFPFFNAGSFFLACSFVLILTAHGHTATEVLNVRHWSAPDHTRIVFDVDGEPDYTIRESANGLILKLAESAINEKIERHMILNKPGIKGVSLSQDEKRNVSIEVVLTRHQKVNVFKLKKFQERPDRIVIDIFLEDAPKDEKITQIPYQTAQTKIIVIDPGHGGEDPGAIGKKGTYEKDIVLAISREIQKSINAIPGYRAVLTRNGDYYVSFNKRLQKTRDMQASLFISVHADAAKNRQAKGSSVYSLSTGAASSEAARLLAQNENLSDIFGGVEDLEGTTETNPIIMNMFQTNTINLSKIYAEMLIKHLQKINCIKYEVVQEAPFRVLKLPEIPAVLLETAYLSNPEEELLLRQSPFQKSLAAAVSASINDYFESIDKSGREHHELKTVNYTVKKGDTLFSIARHHKTNVALILTLNDLKQEDILFIGQTIRVLANDQKTSKQQAQDKTYKFYTVQKGDTLFSIAKTHATTVETLREINRMKITDTLLYGQRIKIP